MVNRRGLMIGGGLALLGVGGAGWAVRRQMGSMTDYEATMADLRAVLPLPPDMRDLIRYATLAPNSHNTQAWTFRAGENNIAILPDFARRTPAVDPDDHHLFVSLGAAAETFAIAAAAAGRPGEIAFDPAGDGTVMVGLGSGGAATEQALFDAIPLRQSTRADYDGSSVSPTDLRLLEAAAAVPGVDLVLITDRSQMDGVRDLVIEGNTTQINDPAFVAELKRWLRFSPNSAARSGDGLFSATSGSPILPDWLGPLLFEMVFTVKAESAKYAAQVATSGGIAVFVGAQADPAHWVQVGQAVQRFSLQATALGLKHAFLNQPVEVAALRDDLATVAGFPGQRPDIVMRFGRGAALPFSARRPVEAVMV